ncbi:hypothetical protein [Paraburkholderia agricolaris]|uniref:hypothetical protein n=1 Tax=Paraburkholderia agricolaris TaxID=2152888 RepID=UPI0012927752|nr:hypothetical protein [Paraburkholderia agricolaris]
MTRLSNVVFWIAAVTFSVAMLALAMLACRIIEQALDSKKDFWDIATAIGTCGAVAVALWFGLRQETLRRRDSVVRARLIGAYLTPRLSVLLDAACKTRIILQTPIGELPLTSKYGQAESACRPMGWVIPPDDLAALTPLPRSTAFRLARAIALMNAVASDIPVKGPSFQRLTTFRTALLNGFIASWEEQLDEAIDLMTAVQAELLSVSAGLVRPA